MIRPSRRRSAVRVVRSWCIGTIGLCATAALFAFTVAEPAPADAVPASAGEPEPADVDVVEASAARAVGSVGLVRSAGGNGSGWVAGPGSIVTNLHVARAGTGDIHIDFSDGERVECYTAVADRDMDLAVLRCPTGDRPVVPLQVSVPEAGTPVAAIGYPGSVGPTTTFGHITGAREEVRSISTVGFTARIAPGSSGSPVIDGAGHAVAVATFGGGLGVPADALVPLLERAERFPGSKSGAEWQLRLRRSAIATAVAAPLAFVVSRRRGGDRPLRSTMTGIVLGVAIALALTQVQFMTSGPAHFL